MPRPVLLEDFAPLATTVICQFDFLNVRAHLDFMAERKSSRHGKFEKPAHWRNDPPPAPRAGEVGEELSPTRYGDWVKKGIAVDF